MSNAGQPLSSKYAPLGKFLADSGKSHVPITFARIEELIGAPLPASARKHRAWWSNNPSNSVITYAWLTAGYRSADVDMAGERLVFRRAGPLAAAPEPAAPAAPSPLPAGPAAPAGGGDHPLWGALRGTVRINFDADLTEPAAPEWEREALAKFLRREGEG